MEYRGKTRKKSGGALSKRKKKVMECFKYPAQCGYKKGDYPYLEGFGINGLIIQPADWNENIAQRLEIRQKIYSLRNFLDYHLSVVNSTRRLKHLLVRIENLLKFTPPSFELSKHYLEALHNIGPNQKKKEGRNKLLNAIYEGGARGDAYPWRAL